MAREEIQTRLSDRLQVLLANMHALGMVVLSAHWNVVGSDFSQLHALFGNQYTEMVAATDVVAEHIRTFDELVPCSYAEFLELSTVAPLDPDASPSEMLEAVKAGHELVLNRLAEIGKQATNESDDATIDLVGERSRAHRKAVWMLRSHLESV
jgi:starvation-inducible DNA-binding protein